MIGIVVISIREKYRYNKGYKTVFRIEIVASPSPQCQQIILTTHVHSSSQSYSNLSLSLKYDGILILKIQRKDEKFHYPILRNEKKKLPFTQSHL